MNLPSLTVVLFLRNNLQQENSPVSRIHSNPSVCTACQKDFCVKDFIFYKENHLLKNLGLKNFADLYKNFYDSPFRASRYLPFVLKIYVHFKCADIGRLPTFVMSKIFGLYLSFPLSFYLLFYTDYTSSTACAI